MQFAQKLVRSLLVLVIAVAGFGCGSGSSTPAPVSSAIGPSGALTNCAVSNGGASFSLGIQIAIH